MAIFQCYAFNVDDLPENLTLKIQRLDGEVLFKTPPEEGSFLTFSPKGLQLGSAGADGQKISLDYQQKLNTFRLQKKVSRGPLAKAIGIDKKKDLKVIDGCLGMATDSLMMVSWGVQVQAYERQVEVYLLNWYAFQQFKKKTHQNISFEIFYGDVRTANTNFDVLYLDPMFPKVRNKRMSKKEMEILMRLTSKDPDEVELFNWATLQNFSRVVIKRPRGAPVYGGPTHSYVSKSVRYDMYSFKPL